MVTARQLDSNRRNARRSTGPKTPRGKAASAANALKAGLFARAVVIPALGETAADFDRFRRQVADDLGAVGPVEQELADQAAALLWRKRRVLAYEAAAAARPGSALPPHPDEVGPVWNPTYRPLPLTAPAATRLGYAQDGLRSARMYLPAVRRAAGLLDPPASPDPSAGGVIDQDAVGALLRAVWQAVGWVCEEGDRRWPDLAGRAGAATRPGMTPEVTGPQLRRAVELAAADAGRDAGAVVAEARERLWAEVGELTTTVGELEKEEAGLVAELQSERQQVVLANLYGDEGMIARVARAEGHLSRELERCLGLLRRSQEDRRAREAVTFLATENTADRVCFEKAIPGPVG